MTNNISLNSSMPTLQMGQGIQKRTLSEDQRTELNSILQNYDSSNMSDSDYAELRDNIKSAGVRPSRELAEALEQEGFEVKGRKPQGPPPPQSTETSDAEIESYLLEILDSYDPDNMTQTDYESLREELQGSGTPPSNELIEALIGEGFDIPSPQSPTGNLASSLTQSLLESLQLFELGELTEEQLSTRIESHASRGAITKGKIVDGHR